MGVNSLWKLLRSVARKVSIETLEGKTLAIDASIFLIQFVHAMRDDEGKMMKNAHISGTLQRILKLLYNRVRPLFVFDGATPDLKRKTMEARVRRRKISETSKHTGAQKLLLAQLKKQGIMKETYAKKSLDLLISIPPKGEKEDKKKRETRG